MLNAEYVHGYFLKVIDMVNEKAQIAKDKGNTAFKAGDYPAAIGHYTTAILADRNDSTYPLNRAAAYLKLGKNEDAERDCTTVLELSKNNVKGLFRRGQARVAQGKLLDARKDFSDVLLVEPSNTAAKEEMKRLTILIQQEKAKKPKSDASSVQASLEPATAAVRRRVPIKIIDSSGKVVQTAAVEPSLSGISEPKSSSAPPPALDVKSPLETLEAVSSRSLKSSTTSESLTLSNPKPNSFSEAKAARENARPSRVGGGIFRASGERTIFATNGVDSPSVLQDNGEDLHPASRFPVTQRTLRYEAPSTLFDFSKLWSSLPPTEERWQYLNTIEPSSLPKLCQTSLEPSLLVSILETFLATLSVKGDLSEIKQRVLAYMEGFANVPRFGTVVLFLSKKEKELAKQVWESLGVQQPSGVWKSVS